MKKIYILFLFIASAGVSAGQTAAEYLMKGRAYLESGKTTDAISSLTDALSRYQESRVFLLRAEAYLVQGDYSSAIGDLNSANKLEPNSGEYGLSRIYALRGDVATSLYHLEANLKSPYRKSEKDIMLDPSFSTVENRPEWRQFWKRDWYGNYEKGLAEIEYYVSINNIADAKLVLEQLAGSYPGGEENIYSEALISFAEGKFGETVKNISGLLLKTPSNEKYLRLLAKAYEKAGNAAGASSAYTRLLDLGIADPELLVLRAESYRHTGETERALADIKKYLELYPGNKKALSFAGRAEVASGDNLKALEYFSENLRLHPGDAECFADRANSYFMAKSWNWAIEDYGMSLDLQPVNPEVWLNKGIALLNSGNVQDACHDFRMAFSQGNRKATELISRHCIR